MAWNENIRIQREKNNLTQQQLADRLYVSRQTVCRWESGSRCPDLAMAKRISEVFGISIDELLSEGDTESRSENFGFLYPTPSKIMAVKKLWMKRAKMRELIQIAAGIFLGINILIMGAYGRQAPAWARGLDICVKAMLCGAYYMASRKMPEQSR